MNQINSVETDLREAQRQLSARETELVKLRKKFGAPFEYQQELAEKYGDLKRLEQELKTEGEALSSAAKAAIEKVADPVRAASEGGPLPESEWLSEAAIAQVVEERIAQFAHKAPVLIRGSERDVLGDSARDDGVASSGMAYPGY